MADENNNADKPNVPAKETGDFSKALGLGLPAPIPAAPSHIVDNVSQSTQAGQVSASSDEKKE